MKLLLFDENMSPRLADTLTDIYPGAVHVNAIGLDKAFDREHLGLRASKRLYNCHKRC